MKAFSKFWATIGRAAIFTGRLWLLVSRSPNWIIQFWFCRSVKSLSISLSNLFVSLQIYRIGAPYKNWTLIIFPLKLHSICLLPLAKWRCSTLPPHSPLALLSSVSFRPLFIFFSRTGSSNVINKNGSIVDNGKIQNCRENHTMRPEGKGLIWASSHEVEKMIHFSLKSLES